MSIIINIVLIILLGWVLAQLKYILKDNYFFRNIKCAAKFNDCFYNFT